MAWAIFVLALMASSLIEGRDEELSLSELIARTKGVAEELFQDENGAAKYLAFLDRSIPVDHVSHSGSSSSGRGRRELQDLDELQSLNKYFKGVYKPTELVEEYTIPCRFPNDMVLFTSKIHATSYAVALEANEFQLDFANHVVLYQKKQNNRYLEVDRKPVMDGVKVEVVYIKDQIYIISAENRAGRNGEVLQGSKVFKLNEITGTLQEVYTLPTQNPSDIISWTDEFGSVFIGVAQEYTKDSSGSVKYSTESVIYQWLGQHFDMLSSVPTHGAKRLSVFRINGALYMAVANHVNDFKQTNIKSEVFRFDSDKKKFVSYQTLSSFAAIDVKYFAVKVGKTTDHFLLIGNSYTLNYLGERDYDTVSVLYKWIDNEFVLYQTFKIDSLVQWSVYSKGPKIILMAASKSSELRIFHFNGFNFEEDFVKSTSISLKANIASIRTFDIEDKIFIAISNKNNNGQHVNVFELRTKFMNGLGSIHEDAQTWCEHAREKIANAKVDSLLAQYQEAPNLNTPEIIVDGTIYFNDNSTVVLLEKQPPKKQSPEDEALLLKVDSQIAELERKAFEAETIISKALKKNAAANKINGRVLIDKASIACPNNDCLFKSATVKNLNDHNLTQFIESTFPLDKPIRANVISFIKVVVPNLNTPFVNGEDSNKLVNRKTTTTLLGPWEVSGTVNAKGGLQVDGLVDGVKIDREGVVLFNGDQTIRGELHLTFPEAENLHSYGRINGMKLDFSKNTLPEDLASIEAVHIPSINISVLNLKDGKISGVNIVDLSSKALRIKDSVQEFHGDVAFASLRSVGGIKSLALSKDLQNLVRISQPIKMKGSLMFKSDLKVNHLQVYDRLNEIKAYTNGTLDLLLTELEDKQIVTGRKEFRTLEVLNRGNVRGKIIGLDLTTLKREEYHAQNSSESLVIHRDITLRDVNLQGDLVVGDVEDETGLSISHIQKHGVSLDSGDIPSVTFSDGITVKSLHTQAINKIRPDLFIKNSKSAQVSASGPITFENVRVKKKLSLSGLVNTVNLEQLEQNALKIHGHQTVLGSKSFNTFTMDRTVADETYVGHNPWAKLISIDSDTPALESVKYIGDVEMNQHLDVQNLFFNGSLNNFSIPTMLEDSIFDDERSYVIKGLKTFTSPITITHLAVDKNAGGTDLSHFHPRSENVLPLSTGSLKLFHALPANKVTFRHTLQDIRPEEWSADWLEKEGDQHINTLTVLGTVGASGGVSVSRGVNGVDLKKVVEEGVRIDDPSLHLHHVNFVDGVRSSEPITLGGNIGGIALSDLLRKDLEKQEIGGHYIFSGGLQVSGELYIDGLLSGDNFTQLCHFAFPKSWDGHQHLVVEGNLNLEKEMSVKNIYNYDLNALLRDSWLRVSDARITSAINMSVMDLKNKVSVQQYINEVSLADIVDQRISLTGETPNGGNVITAPLLAREIYLHGNLETNGRVEVDGHVGGLKLEEFVNEVLRSGVDQDISARLEFNVVEVSNLKTSSTFNNIDLNKDVARRDRPNRNIITAKKTALGAIIEKLSLKKGVRIQDVDIIAWNETAVRFNGTQHTITSPKILTYPIFTGGLSLWGVLNGVQFNSEKLLLRVGDQIVTGRKEIDLTHAPKNSVVSIAYLKVNKVNDIEIDDFLDNVVHWTGASDEIVTPVVMNGSINAKTAWVKETFGEVSIDSLIEMASNRPVLNEYFPKYDELLLTASNISRSLNAQGLYLNYYRTAVSYREKILACLPLGYYGKMTDAIAFVLQSSPGGWNTVKFYQWNSEKERLESHPKLSSVDLPPVHLIVSSMYAGRTSIYYETPVSAGSQFLGITMALKPNGTLVQKRVISTSFESKWAAQVQLGRVSCVIRGSPGDVMGKGAFCTMHCRAINEYEVSLNSSRPWAGTAIMVKGHQHVFIASALSRASEGGVDIYINDMPSSTKLELQQTLNIVNASGVDAIEYRSVVYLAVIVNKIDGGPGTGMVHILRNVKGQNYKHVKAIDVEAPIKVKFAELPTNELVLYVPTECPAEPLVILQYKGIENFVKIVTTSDVPLSSTINPFNFKDHNHFVSLTNSRNGQGIILKAEVKGNWAFTDKAYKIGKL